MAKILIVYQSQTGFTQQFALWLAKGLHCELLEIKFVTEADFAQCDLVLYGGHVLGKQVAGFKRFYRRFAPVLPPQLVVFGTGVTNLNTQDVARIRTASFKTCPALPQFFYLQGQAGLAPLPLSLRIRLRVRGVAPEDCAHGRRAVQPVLDAVHRMDPHTLW